MIRDWIWHLDEQVSHKVRTVLDRVSIVPVLTIVAHSGDSAVDRKSVV